MPQATPEPSCNRTYQCKLALSTEVRVWQRAVPLDFSGTSRPGSAKVTASCAATRRARRSIPSLDRYPSSYALRVARLRWSAPLSSMSGVTVVQRLARAR
jgi:hypothetical protein